MSVASTKPYMALNKILELGFNKLSSSLVNWGFQCSRANSSLFFKHTSTDVIILLIYVDDTLVIGGSTVQVHSFITHLRSTFSLRDLSPINYFLGLEIHRDKSHIHLGRINTFVACYNGQN